MINKLTKREEGVGEDKLNEIKADIANKLSELPTSAAKGVLSNLLDEIDFISIVDSKLLSKRYHSNTELSTNSLK